MADIEERKERLPMRFLQLRGKILVKQIDEHERLDESEKID